MGQIPLPCLIVTFQLFHHKMNKKIKFGIVFLVLLISFSFNSYNSNSYAGVDDAVVAGIGCIAGGILGGRSCYPYEPPELSGNDKCSVCNEDPFGKCTEYKCRAIGEDCRFVQRYD